MTPMIDTFEPETFLKAVTSGRTRPILLASYSSGEDIEVFCKLSAGCDEGVSSLAREVVASCLAADLKLPIPKPYLVTFSLDFIASVPDDAERVRIQNSNATAFGSSRVQNQFSNWIDGTALPDRMVQSAAEILFFDAVTQNVDRRGSNPNCLVRGDELRIFDHELAFSHGLMLGWVPPWETGGMSSISAPGHHIFTAPLKGRHVNTEQIKARWSGLSDERLAEYQDSIPNDWDAASTTVSQSIQLVRDARNRIDDCVQELIRVLS